MPRTSQARIKEVRLRHYRAFSNVRWVLDKITFLVGRNGAGKSTLMDALSFISEAVTDSLGTALERRGNLEGIRRRQPGRSPKYDVSLAAVLEFSGTPVLWIPPRHGRVEDALCRKA
jgi:predicted ATPase